MTDNSSAVINANPLENPSISLRDPVVWTSIFGGGETDAGVSVNSRSAMGYPPLWRAISLVAGDVAKMPLNVFRREADGGKEAARKHPAWKLLTLQVSDVCDSMTFRETLTAMALLRGNGYAAIVRNNRRDPVELIILDSAQTYPILLGGELWYVTQSDGRDIRLPARDVLHIKGLSADGLVGYDLVTLMADALGVGMAAMQFGAKFFGRGANASGMLMVPGTFSEERVRNTIEAFNELSSGMSNAHKIGLLQDGVKFQQLTVTPDQAQFLETRKHEIRTVAQIIGCPNHKLGDTETNSHSSLEAENQAYLDNCLDKWLRKWEVECCRKLLSDTQKTNGTHFIEFNRKSLLRMSATDRANYYSRLQEHGSLTVNDVLRAENMPTIGESGDRRYRPGNLLEIGPEPDGPPIGGQPALPGPAAESDSLLVAVVEDRVQKSLKLEAGAVAKAAGRESDFLEWLDGFYTSWVENSSSTSDMRDAFVIHAEESMAQLASVACSATRDSLAGAVGECVATWGERGESLTTEILKGQDNG